MPIRQYDLSKIQPTFAGKGVRDRVRGGALATVPTRDAALYSQMQSTPHGRRVLCRAGIQGQSSTLVVSGANTTGSPQVYPTATSTRIMVRARVKLTAGYSVEVYGLFLPNGPTQQFNLLGGNWVEGAPVGSLRVDLLLDNGGQDEQSVSLVPDTSNLQFKALPAQAGGCWGVLGAITASLQRPQAPGWAEDVYAEIVISAIGGCRPVDVVVYEKPSRAQHDESHRECTLSGFPEAGAGSEYPLTAVSQPNNGIKGSQQANKSMGDLRQTWGPTLMHWSCWNEDTALVTQSEGTPVSITTSLGFRSLQATATIVYGANNHGWSVSSGGYARNIEQSGLLELRDKVGCIPVIVRAWARMTNAAHVGTIRFATADYSLRDLTITGFTTFRWYSGLAWLRVPIHASLDSLLQVSAKVAFVGHTMEIRYVSVEYGGHYAVTD